MATEIVVPALGESVTEATIAQWLKSVGDPVDADEALVELETDKVTLEINAPIAGMLSEIRFEQGADVEVGAVLGVVAEGKICAAKAAEPPKPVEAAPVPAAEPRPATTTTAAAKSAGNGAAPAAEAAGLSPAVRRLVDDNRLDPALIPATGKDGRLTKGDVIAYLDAQRSAPAPCAPAAAKPSAAKPSAAKPAAPAAPGAREERVPMTRLRKRIAARLKEAQNTAAMLTTFNEVDMSAILATRAQYKEAFEKKHGVRLGFMSFFIKASIVALRELPSVNAQIDGDDIVYKNHYDIGVAVGTEQGLVVPVVRDADRMSFAEIESTIADLGRRARDGKLTMDELSGGTFTITNGGVYGSLMSTPILNPPQSGILGMHKTQKRPIAVGDTVEVRPMMYLALSYDHRIIDGREAVTFLVRLKECIEDPERIMLDM